VDAEDFRDDETWSVSNLVMTGVYTVTPAIVRACQFLQPATRGEYEIFEAIDLLIQSGRTIDVVELDGWRIGVGSPEDRDEAETRLQTTGQPVPEQ
jgi:glucose-1-phosphate thymidylyltransferase